MRISQLLLYFVVALLFVSHTMAKGKKTALLFQDNFNRQKLNSNWKQEWGIALKNADKADWQIVDGALVGTATSNMERVAVIPDSDHKNFIFTAKFKFLHKNYNNKVSFILRFSPPGTLNKLYWCGYSIGVTPKLVTFHKVDPVWRSLSSFILEKGEITTGQWYEIRIVCVGVSIKCFLNDKLILDEEDGSFRNGKIALCVKNDVKVAFDDVKIYIKEN